MYRRRPAASLKFEVPRLYVQAGLCIPDLLRMFLGRISRKALCACSECSRYSCRHRSERVHAIIKE
jgi:hypothetical protein